MSAQSNLFDRETAGALLSPDGVYRYLLWRKWAPDPYVLWVCLNPSTADGFTDDATVRRIRGFSKACGFGGFEIANLYAYRATDPKALWKAQAGGIDVVGPDNTARLLASARMAGQVIVAWGNNVHHDPVHEVEAIGALREATKNRLTCLRLTKHGHPEHPLRLPANLRPIPFDPRAA